MFHCFPNISTFMCVCMGGQQWVLNDRLWLEKSSYQHMNVQSSMWIAHSCACQWGGTPHWARRGTHPFPHFPPWNLWTNNSKLLHEPQEPLLNIWETKWALYEHYRIISDIYLYIFLRKLLGDYIAFKNNSKSLFLRWSWCLNTRRLQFKCCFLQCLVVWIGKFIS